MDKCNGLLDQDLKATLRSVYIMFQWALLES